MTSLEPPERDRSLAAEVPETQDAAPAPLEPAGVDPGRRLPRRTWLAAIASVLVLPIAVAAVLTYTAGSSDAAASAAAARVVSAVDMEKEYGIKVDLVAVTAAGGLVDLRFTVIDKDKAVHVLHDAASMPELFVETSGTVLSVRKGMHHGLTLLDGARYFILYSNSGGVVQAGTPVSIVIDGIRLAPIDAQS